MNFLLHALEGSQNDGEDGFGDDGGWGSEEDIDLSDDEGEYDTETTGYDTEATPQQQHHHQQQQHQQQHYMHGNPPAPPPPPPPPQTDSGTMRVGGGMFMGRLTQFLDTVAPQQVEADEGGFSEGNGWADDDLDVDVDVDVDVDAGGWADDDAQDALSQLDDGDDAAENTEYAPNDANTSIYTSQAVVAPAAVPPPAVSDPSASFGAPSLSSSAGVGMASTAGMNQTFDSGNQESNDDGSGWDEDDGLLFDDEDNNDVVDVDVNDAIEADITFETEPIQSQTVESIPPPPPPPPPPINTDDNGWDDGDDGLLFDDNSDDDNAQDVPDVGDVVLEAETVGETKAAESLQFPPPPPPEPLPAPTDGNNDDEGAGWDDDDGLVFDDEEGEDVTEADVSAGMEAKKLPPSGMATPPPPPPPPPVLPLGGTNADPSLSFGGETISSTAAVGIASTGDITNDFDENDIAEESGWDDDDGLLNDVVEANVTADEEIESSQLVDSTPPPPPPPPPPPLQTTVSDDDGLGDASALDNEDGWGEDEDVGMNISDDFDANSAEQENKNVVDHIPSPSPPRKLGDVPTNDATDGDDDISQDDTLSIANSRSQQNAVTGGYRVTSNSTFGDEDSESAAEVPTTDFEVEVKHAETTVRTVSTFGSGSGRLASRRVVDFTPRRTRFSGNDSLMVSGHTSVGESLDSIDEANEEDYEDELDVGKAQTLRKPSGWGALKQQSASTPSKSEQVSSESLFASGSTPTATNSNNTPNRFAAIKKEDTDANKMVDHTPGITASAGFRPEFLSRKPSMAASIDVLGESSEGDLGENDTVGMDDIKDELYGPMVDQIPPTPRDDSPTRRQRKLSSEQASVGSTVVGQAETIDIQEDIHNDDAMDEEEEGGEEGVDESSKGWGGSHLEFDNRSLLSGLPLPVVDETQYLVDHVPVDKLLRGGGAASTMVMMDASMASSRADENVDGSNNVNFGPIVDHTPSLAGPSRGAPSIATSVATAVSGLDGDIKEDDDMDNTTVAGGTVDSVGPREDEDLGKVEDDHIVDHVPQGKALPVNPDASVRVLVGKDDEITHVDTIAEDVALEFGPIVDQTPLPFSRTTSGGLSVEASFRAQRHAVDDNNTATLGSFTEADDNSGWDHDEPDLDDLSTGDRVVALADSNKEENNLVDHIPRRSFTKPVDGSTIVLVDPVDAASEVDDADDDTAGNARVDKFGPVVDHTPAPQSAPLSLATSMMNQANGFAGSENRPDADIDGSATWYGASTLGGISSAAGDDDSGTGWDEDDLGDLASPIVPRPLQTPVNDHLVDHIPSLASPRNMDANASTAVAIDPSVVSNQTQDDKMGGGLFGAVVDHTPSLDPHTRRSADNSTMVTGFATNTKQDEEMDETTWQGGVSAQGEGWDQDDPELEELANGDEVTSPHLVDHVPERPESRYGDPSLIVAANPSDMSSQVEDLNQDENHFGPVVDQTPLERVLPPPAVGSTVVALPSVLNDVSDEGDNDGSNAEGARVPNEWEEQIPNPQSGIDADNTREQLVDAVPPPPPPEQQPMVRDASSEMATVDDKSTLVPADEPKEDEFGPVVDHTPMGESTNGVETQHGETSPGDGDKKPAANMDSVAPIYSVESKEKEDGLDEDEFGPVVDQLPASCSKSSLAPSKGGSTVDALATVSEGEDDLNTRDGWDDDTLDLVDQVSPANMSHRANHSVTWDENVFQGKQTADQKAINTSKQSNDMADSTFFTAAESNDSSRAMLDETKFYDTEEAEMNGWASDSLNIADDDTPPSTPRASAIFNKKSSVDTADYSRFRTLLETNGDNGSSVGAMKMNEGKADLQKLLQEEMAKSLLLEKESEALRKMVDSLKEAKVLLMTAAKQHVGREEELIGAISKWEEANGDLSSKNVKLSEDVSKLKNENVMLSEDVSKYQNENGKLLSENGKLSEDVSRFRSENDQLSSKNGMLSAQNRKLSEDVSRIENEFTDLRSNNDLLTSELESLRKSVSQLEDEKAELATREAAHSAEISNLKASLEKQLQKSTSDASLRENIRSTQTELSAKVNECSQLNSKLILVEEKLRKSDAQSFKHTKDLARMTKDHMQKISDLQKQIDSRQKDIEELTSVNEKSIVDLERRLTSESASNEKLQQENSSLLRKTEDLQSQLQNASHGIQNELSQRDADIQSLDAKLKIAQDNNTSLTDQVNNYAQQLERFSSISAELEFITKERDVLKEELVDCKTYIASMQKHFNDLNSFLELKNSKPELLVEAIKNDRANQLREIQSSQNQISDLTCKLNELKSEKNSVQAQFEEYRKSHGNSQKASAVSALNAIKEEAKLKKIQGEIHQLRTQLQIAKKELQDSESERTKLSNRSAVLEAEVAQLGDIATQNSRLKDDLLRVQEDSKSQGQRIETLQNNILENERILSLKEQEIASLREQQRSSESDRMGIEREKQNLLVKLEEMNSRITGLESERDAYAQEMNGRIVELGARRDTHAQEMNARIAELGSQCDALVMENEQKNGQLDSLNEELQELSNEIEIVRGERESLEEENEDMLVQFGLVNEEMIAKEAELVNVAEELKKLEEEHKCHERVLQDAKNEALAYREQLEDERRKHEEQLRAKDEEKNSKEEELESHLQIARRRSQEYESQLHMSEEKLNSLIRESEEVAKNVGNVDDNTKKLIDVNTALRDKIQAMASEQTAVAEKMQAMESHKLGLNGEVDGLRNLVDELIASFGAKEGKLQSDIKGISAEKDEIANKYLGQEKEIVRLRQELETSHGAAEECAALRREMTDMENKLTEQDRLLLQKDAAAKDLYNQLQGSGNVPAESAEMEMLRDTVRDLEATVSNDRKRLQELEGICDQTQQDLFRRTEQLQVSTETVQQLESDLQSKQTVESTNQMLESRLDQLEQELMTARTEEKKHRNEAAALKEQILGQQSSKELSHELYTELVALRQQVESLEKEKDLASSAPSAREKAMEQELRSLQDQLAQKDEKMAGMEDKLQSLDEDLNQSKQLANEKNANIDELKAEIEKMKSLVSETSTSQLLEDNHMMSTQLISLAQAFEKSEMSRAEMLEKMETERRAHAETLQQFKVNMKRFYATLRMSDV